jgi:hypothetical protein
MAKLKARGQDGEKPAPDIDMSPDPGPEKDLAGKIQKYCKENGLPCQ